MKVDIYWLFHLRARDLYIGCLSLRHGKWFKYTFHLPPPRPPSYRVLELHLLVLLSHGRTACVALCSGSENWKIQRNGYANRRQKYYRGRFWTNVCAYEHPCTKTGNFAVLANPIVYLPVSRERFIFKTGSTPQVSWGCSGRTQLRVSNSDKCLQFVGEGVDQSFLSRDSFFNPFNYFREEEWNNFPLQFYEESCLPVCLCRGHVQIRQMWTIFFFGGWPTTSRIIYCKDYQRLTPH